jgi:hypothetical protein
MGMHIYSLQRIFIEISSEEMKKEFYLISSKRLHREWGNWIIYSIVLILRSFDREHRLLSWKKRQAG